MGDVSKLNRQDFETKFKKVYSGRIAKNTMTKDIKTLWSFYHNISLGDIIIARRGTKKIIGIGTVTGAPFYDERKGKDRVANLTDDAYSNFIPVQWDIKEITFDKIVFSFYTMYKIPEEKYQNLIEGTLSLSESDEDEELMEEQSVEFVLEKYLEDFIVANFKKIFKDKLKIYEDPDGNIGQQYRIINNEGKLLGRIDILARDSNNNSFVVIELKKGRESDKVVGQVLRYMGWVKENLCEKGEDVKGLIICKEIDESMVCALNMVQDIIQTKSYSVDFTLSDIS